MIATIPVRIVHLAKGSRTQISFELQGTSANGADEDASTAAKIKRKRMPMIQIAETGQNNIKLFIYDCHLKKLPSFPAAAFAAFFASLESLSFLLSGFMYPTVMLVACGCCGASAADGVRGAVEAAGADATDADAGADAAPPPGATLDEGSESTTHNSGFVTSGMGLRFRNNRLIQTIG